ncbi:MAG: BREX system P-loop protein BrxC, partial [Planctomycetota bacterium]
RFFPPLSLSSANVDEVIQSRLLTKLPEVKDDLEGVFAQKGDILKNQLTFTNCGMTFKKVNSGEEFVKNYPFVPYQFQLLQKIFEAIRKAGATGMHLARGERSMLDAFQSAAKAVSMSDVGVLVPLSEFYPSIESFLDTSVKKTIDQAKTNSSLEPFDIRLLQVLFLIRYVDEMKGNADNLVTLCLDQIDADRLALRRKIEESLLRLEKETLINRSGENYFFLTNEERDINKEIKAVDLSGGEEAKLLGEIIFDDILKGQRKHRYSANKMDFGFNRRCDNYPVGSQKDGVLLVSVITPLADDYESYDKAKCILDSTADDGFVLLRLANDESLGRELRTCLQTEKYLSRKNDGTLPPATLRILRDCAEGNRQRRERLTALLSDMVTSAECFVAGQPLKLKSSTPEALFSETMEYLIQNTFDKMSYLKRLTPQAELPKEIQSVLRSNDITKEQLMFENGENNPEAIEELRHFFALCSAQSRQVVLHDMIEKRYALRPYGWPDDEVLLLVARLLILGEIRLMMDGANVSLEKVYELIMAPAKRRKIVLVNRHTPDPEVLQKVRNLGKELFAEMGPDGEDGLFAFLQGKLKDWQADLNTYKPLADTGNYPGREEIADGLTLVNKLLADKDGSKFIERFILLKNDLLDFAERYHDLQNFYAHQRSTWERLRKARQRFQLNRLDLERDVEAAPALRRIQDILSAPSPYGLIKDADGLISTVSTINSALLIDRRKQAVEKIDDHYGTLTKDMAAVNGDAALRAGCLKPLEKLRQQVEQEESVAHLAQAEAEAVKEFDAGIARIEEFSRTQAEKPVAKGGPVVPPAPVFKKVKVVKPTDFVKTAYLVTPNDVNGFLDALRQELETALANEERIQIR